MCNEGDTKLFFYGDSSSHNKKYMVAGGFCVNTKRISEIQEKIKFIKEHNDIKSEFHWSEYRKGGKTKVYKELVDYMFGLVFSGKAHFHVIIANFSNYKHNATPGEGRETSVNRMYYQLLLHKLAKFYGKMADIHVQLDHGNDSQDICKMRNQVCANAYFKYQCKPNCIKSITSICSKKSEIIQASDVVIGSIAGLVNGFDEKSAKKELAEYIMKAAKISTWRKSTPKDERSLTVWWHVTKESQP